MKRIRRWLCRLCGNYNVLDRHKHMRTEHRSKGNFRKTGNDIMKIVFVEAVKQ